MTDLVLAAGSQSAGPIGLLVVILIGVAMVLLIRNMDKRVKRLPKQFPDESASTTSPAPPAQREQPPS